MIFTTSIVIAGMSNQDSLLLKVNTEDNRIIKCDLLNDIAYNYLSNEPEKSISYADEAFQVAFEINYLMHKLLSSQID